MHQSIDRMIESGLKMINAERIGPPKSRLTVWKIDEASHEKEELFTTSNLIMYTWAFPVIKALFHGDPDYRLSAMYFEFENVASPGDPASIPVYGRDASLSYYSGLASSKDFLRVTLSGLPSITVESGYEVYFSAGQGNVANCFAQTSGTAGILGETFSDVSNSKVYGVGLVATPDWSDRTQDILFARSYFDVSNQQLKVAGSQIGVTWSIPLL